MERPPLALAASTLVGLAALVVAKAAGAQGKTEIAYDRAVAEMVARRYEAACPMIEEVYRLDPRPARSEQPDQATQDLRARLTASASEQ